MTTTTRVTRRDRRKNTPAAFLRSEGRKPEGRLLVCIGDSITRGDVSSDWVARLRSELADEPVGVVNAGVNGELAWNVLQRLDDVVACRPELVTLLIGTNDVCATYSSDMERMYRRRYGIPRTPDLDWYRSCVDQILERLRAQTAARIAVVQIPPLGGDMGSVMNRRVDDYNAALQQLADMHGIDVLPLHDRLVELIPSGREGPDYDPTTGRIIRAAISHSVLRRSWDDVSRRNGMAVLTDSVHLNDRAAGVLRGMVHQFVARGGR